MTQKNTGIQGKFYSLDRQEWLYDCRELTPAQTDVFYVRTLDPHNKGIEINAAHIARQLSSAQSKVYRQTVSHALKEFVTSCFLPKQFLHKLVQFDDKERQIGVDAKQLVVRHRLKSELGGQTEVVIAVGRIDLLTATEVIEIKNIDDWKEALGKILAYSAFFPNHSKRIHLFGKQNLAKLALAQGTCSEFGITVTFEEVG